MSKTYSNLSAFIQSHYREKDSTLPQTNTRIRDDKYGVKGGSYSIQEEEYPQFLELYGKDIVMKGESEYLTELQLPSDGPILIDLDLHYPYECETRHYTKDHLDDFVGACLEKVKTMYQFDAETKFRVFLLEKDAINRVQEKNITKDGIHIVVGISVERKVQILLRQKMLEVLPEMWGSSLPVINKWEDVYDNSITTGQTGWQLYGSRKPGHEPYKLTYIYEVGYDPDDQELIIDCKPAPANKLALLPELSARYKKHPRFFYKTSFIKELEAIADPSPRKQVIRGATPRTPGQNTPNYLHIKNAEDLKNAVDEFYASLKESEYELLETCEYTMALPASYYETGSYAKWIRVGMALSNTDARLFIVWLDFSAKSSTFSFSSISDLYEKWQNFLGYNRQQGLSDRSIAYWCRSECNALYREIRLKSTNSKLNYVIGNCDDIDLEAKVDRKGTTDYDIATILHHMHRDMYKCVSITNNIWYRYEEPNWVLVDSGTTLRKSISTELRAIYTSLANKCMEKQMALATEKDDTFKFKKQQKQTEKVLGVCARLGSTNDKKNIMVEAKELFYDDKFVEKLDSNPHLLCFKNGVVDFKEKRFRRAYPEDYLTKCTNTNYRPTDSVQDAVVMKEITDFMHQLFPEKDVHDYMWEHLASTLIGVLPNQTWNMYIGDGQNGKSMLVEIMEHILGNYKGTVATNLITDRRTKIGGACPEIIGLKGLRYAVMQETQKGDRVNEGVMKQLTSGMDTIEGRGLYMPKVEVFYPQFKMVLCSNYLMDIKSNDHGTWRRIRVVPFKSLFTDNPVNDDPEKPYQFKIDHGLRDKCKGWTEVFTSMLVDIAFQTQGFVKDCDAVLAASNAYRQSQDYIAEFISDRMVADPQGSLTKTELSVEFKSWYETTYGRGSPNIKEVQAHMDKKYKKCTKRKVWLGVRISYDMHSAQIEEPDEIYMENT